MEAKPMHAVIRTYSGSGAKELFDLLEERTSDVEQIMRSIDGFVSYMLVRTSDGGTTVTVFEDESGAEESVRKARDWVATNASDTGVGGPTVSQGSVILYSTPSGNSAGSAFRAFTTQTT
jgi:hypothetical protein